MAKEVSKARLQKHGTDLRVVHDLAPDYPITAAELDAIEAYLAPLLTDFFVRKKAGNGSAATGFDSEPPQSAAK